jgi:hypothetical protein
MVEKKNNKRTFESELRSLPIDLVPPDPQVKGQARKSPSGVFEIQPFAVETGRGVVDKLIDRIKRI